MKLIAGYLVFVALSFELLPQNLLQEQYNYAFSLFGDGKYFDSITEFKRLDFFDSSGIYKSRSNFYIGTAYKKGGFYIEAIEYLSEALFASTDQDSIFKINIEIIKCNILRRTTYRALTMLQEAADETKDPSRLREVNLLRGMAYAFAGNWESAGKFFILSGNEHFAQIADRAYEEEYSETAAKIMSAILPGSGQAYTGNYLNGIMSLALNAATLYFTIDAFMSDRIFDGIIIGNFLWLRFYLGNIYNAGKFAKENNEEVYNESLRLLQESGTYSIQ